MNSDLNSSDSDFNEINNLRQIINSDTINTTTKEPSNINLPLVIPPE